MALTAFAAIYFLFLFFISLIQCGEAIQCYQCDSQEDESCPQDRYFDPRLNAMVDCSSFEAKVPGVFCLKMYQESTGWNSWIKITRRCGSRTTTGVAWGCRYWFEAMGIYREMCYCQDRDGCNSGPRSLSASLSPLLLTCLASFVAFLTSS